MTPLGRAQDNEFSAWDGEVTEEDGSVVLFGVAEGRPSLAELTVMDLTLGTEATAHLTAASVAHLRGLLDRFDPQERQ